MWAILCSQGPHQTLGIFPGDALPDFHGSLLVASCMFAVGSVPVPSAAETCPRHNRTTDMFDRWGADFGSWAFPFFLSCSTISSFNHVRQRLIFVSSTSWFHFRVNCRMALLLFEVLHRPYSPHLLSMSIFIYSLWIFTEVICWCEWGWHAFSLSL